MKFPRPTLRPLCLAISLTSSSCLSAQEAQPKPATSEACMVIESDATRLACYDAAAHRKHAGPQAADAQAVAARQELHQAKAVSSPTEQTEQRRFGALYGSDDPMIEDALANAGKGSLLDSRWELAKDSKLGVFQMRGYKPVYLLPAFWTSDKNETPQSPNPNNVVTEPQPLKSVEAKFQLSFKTKFVENIFGDNGDLWGAYTQSSRWQVYNADISRPFRETNYEPEVMLVFRNNYQIAGWNGRMSGISLAHQSNGRSDPLSRSWNRVILSLGLDRDNWAFVVRPWYRLKESADVDNNADIEDFVGRGDAMLTYSNNGHEFTVLGRHSLRSGDHSRGSLQLDYGFPISRQLRGHVQVFDGYGESLIDYNHKATYFGLGISLLEWY